MYYSSNPIGEEDDHAHVLKVATSKKPEEPFQFQKQFLDLFSIDPHVVRDSVGGMYIFYSSNAYTGVDRHCAGTAVLVDKMLDFYTLKGDPKPVIIPSLKEEVFAYNRFGDGRNWHTVEGAFYLEKDGYAYVMYSGNAFLSPTYFVGYSRAKKDGK